VWRRRARRGFFEQQKYREEHRQNTQGPPREKTFSLPACAEHPGGDIRVLAAPRWLAPRVFKSSSRSNERFSLGGACPVVPATQGFTSETPSAGSIHKQPRRHEYAPAGIACGREPAMVIPIDPSKEVRQLSIEGTPQRERPPKPQAVGPMCPPKTAEKPDQPNRTSVRLPRLVPTRNFSVS